MKKILLKLAENVLSREQMRIVKGGYDAGGNTCPNGVGYVTQQQCDTNCKGKTYSKCEYNSNTKNYGCSCTD